MSDNQFVISMTPADLRYEVLETLAVAKTPLALDMGVWNEDLAEDMEWWKNATDEQYEQLAYYMMNSDYLWTVWRQVFLDGVSEMKKELSK